MFSENEFHNKLTIIYMFCYHNGSKRFLKNILIVFISALHYFSNITPLTFPLSHVKNRLMTENQLV